MKLNASAHWRAPGRMLVGLLVGILLALGHHLFYSSLHGTVASTSPLGHSRISTQEANNAIGIAFAFLVKIALVYAVSVAVTQAFWYENTAQCKEGAPTLARLDAMSSVLRNLWLLFDIRLWQASPWLSLLASAAWLVPIASIVTPAALSIQTARIQPDPVHPRSVPNLDFRSLNFVGDMPCHSMPSQKNISLAKYDYEAPSQEVLSITSALVAEGKTLPITPPAPNSSWTLSFAGPSLHCDEVSEGARYNWTQNILDYINIQENCSMLYGYLAWYPGSGLLNGELTEGLPFLASAPNGPLEFSPGFLTTAVNSSVGQDVTFNIVVLPSLAEAWKSDPSFSPCYKSARHPNTNMNTSVQDTESIQGTMLQCRLYNSTYDVSFQFNEGSQAISVSTQSVDDAQPLPIIGALVGPAEPSHLWLQRSNEYPNIDPDANANLAVLRDLSYQAVMDSFTASIKGAIFLDDNVGSVNITTNIADTALINLQALAFLRPAKAPSASNFTLQHLVAQSVSQNAEGLLNDELAATSPQSLKDAMGEMFQNLVVSLMSSTALQPNSSAISAPPALADVILPTYQNVYVYSAQKLWLAYGIALLLCLAAVIVGTDFTCKSRASYSDNFSTAFRAARGAGIDIKLLDKDLDGQDPLPARLRQAKVLFKQRHVEGVSLAVSSSSYSRLSVSSENNTRKSVKYGEQEIDLRR